MHSEMSTLLGVLADPRLTGRPSLRPGQASTREEQLSSAARLRAALRRYPQGPGCQKHPGWAWWEPSSRPEAASSLLPSRFSGAGTQAQFTWCRAQSGLERAVRFWRVDTIPVIMSFLLYYYYCLPSPASGTNNELLNLKGAQSKKSFLRLCFGRKPDCVKVRDLQAWQPQRAQ